MLWYSVLTTKASEHHIQPTGADLRVVTFAVLSCMLNSYNFTQLQLACVVWLQLNPGYIRKRCTKIFAGVDIIVNGSGSHHQLRKLDARLDLMRSATAKAGGVYLYANQRGCDGGRLYFDGCACALSNGELLAQGGQFNLKARSPLAVL